jgi:holliday junction DNA helicase RuvA
MIGSLRGLVLERGPDGHVLLEVGGVGYRVTVPLSALGAVGEPGGSAFLHVHTHVREDALILFGFPTADERYCFEALIGAHGVGPSLALALLSVHPPSALRRAVATDDVDALTAVPGIGKKTAARLLLELKARLGSPDESFEVDGVGAVAEGPRSSVKIALTSLGYSPDEVKAALTELPEEGTEQELLRLALRAMAGSR